MSRFRRTGSRSLAATANEENRGPGDLSAIIRDNKYGSGLLLGSALKVAAWYARSRRLGKSLFELEGSHRNHAFAWRILELALTNAKRAVLEVLDKAT